MSKEETKTLVLENTSRRDLLIENEKKYQDIWQKDGVFEVDVPEDPSQVLSGEELAKKYPSYLATMAYPYMNGVLHAGHCFTLSKVEFATGFERMNGKHALFPLGFHCTGLPINAAADKLVREIEQFGENFDQGLPEQDEQEDETKAAKVKEDITKFSSKKSKVAQKTGRAKYQFEIMLQLDIPREEIKNFADPYYWIYYFSPKCQADCNLLGVRIDWRRSFVTTNVNPYYDSFVRWTMNSLKSAGKIKFGKRYTIYSAKDGQPCMDHDRQSGESVNPQEYTGIKIKISEWAPKALKSVEESGVSLDGKNTFLVAATLRPETMYGQNCCYVSPKINYGIFDAGNNEYFICTERAFKNMCFQELTPQRGYYKPVAWISGADLIGSKIKAPLSVYPEVRVLPMETILPNKGTGVVTSVPSDSPDDYITMLDLQNKPDYYKIEKEWAAPGPVAIIETPTYGDKTAQALVEEFKIKSPKDKDALAKAKELAYKEGYYQGTMVIGKYKGLKVEDAKPKVKQDLIDSNEAFAYSEPESEVVSRSGDVCVVALQDQWYTDYGEDSWKAAAEECLKGMNLYSPEIRHGFEKVLDWLKNWALSRTYGLGSRIPWDNQYLVESLSDSTVYMAYYTICHYLHKDFYGKEKGTLDISADEMTDEVWDYVFHKIDSVKESSIPQEKLDTMKKSFGYFYPMDLRVSAKDLIPNHLTFCIYVHTALFPKRFWPKAFRVNGHLLLNNEKMSKSTGNFMTLRQTVQKYGADAARIAWADAGDTVEDANFDEANANAAILRLYTLREWTEDIINGKEDLREGEADTFFDKAFNNEMNQLIETTYKNYESATYKAALKSGLFDLQLARDFYRDATNGIGLKMHRDIIKRYIEVQALLITPIAPHFAEWIWREALGHKTTVHSAQFPKPNQPIDKGVSAALEYVRETARSIRETEGSLLKKKKKGNDFDPKKPSKLVLYIAKSFPEWQDKYIELVRDAFESQSLDFSPDFKQKIAKMGDVKNGMKFVNFLKQRLTFGGEAPEQVFSRELLFDESETVKAVESYLRRATNNTKIEETQIIEINAEGQGIDLVTGEKIEVPQSKVVQDAVPGQPGIVISNL